MKKLILFVIILSSLNLICFANENSQPPNPPPTQLVKSTGYFSTRGWSGRDIADYETAYRTMIRQMMRSLTGFYFKSLDVNEYSRNGVSYLSLTGSYQRDVPSSGSDSQFTKRREVQVITLNSTPGLCRYFYEPLVERSYVDGILSSLLQDMAIVDYEIAMVVDPDCTNGKLIGAVQVKIWYDIFQPR